jgi:nucleoside-diphosphate-sugar epimerase
VNNKCYNPYRELEVLTEWIGRDSVKGKAVLITGGAGFIGSWLSEALIALGARVTVLDNLSTGSQKNIECQMSLSDFKFLKGDVSNFKLKDRYDFIVHAASLPAPEMYVEKPVDSMLPNSLGTLNVLEAARKYDSIVLYTSTSEVYGDPEVIPHTRELLGQG